MTPAIKIGQIGDYRDFLLNVLESSTEYSVIASDLEGLILLWNEGAHRIFGYTSEDVVGRVRTELLHIPEDIASGKAAEVVREALTRGKWEGILKRRRKNGEVFTARVVKTVRRDAAGKAVGFLLVSKDISGEERLTQQLMESQEYNRGLIEASVDAFITVDPQDVITDVNQQMEKSTGYTRDELVGSKFGDYFTEPERATAGVRKTLEQGFVKNYELVLRTKDNREAVVSFNASVFKDAEGKVRGVFASARDITEDRAAEQRTRDLNADLERSTAELREAQRVARMGSWSWTAEGSHTEWSDEMFRMFGLERGGEAPSLEGFLAVIHPDDRTRVAANIQAHWTQPGAFEYAYRLVRPDGVELRLHGRNENIADASRQVVRMVGTIQDVTETYAAEQRVRDLNAALVHHSAQLAEANKEMESFAYSVSHDLRGPLRSLDGFSQILAEEYADKLDPQAQDYLRRIQGSAGRMGNLIDALLGLSRVGRLEMRPERVDLTAAARSLAGELAQGAPARNVEFRIADGLAAQADPALVRAVLQNLMANAWKFTSKKEHATIEVGAEQRDGATAFFVRDDGAGFDAAFAEKLFKPFQRLHAQDEFEGTGIGLATVHRIVARHGGRAWAEGAEDHGATFWFTLAPGVAGPAAHPAPKQVVPV